jgi:Copper type II ascorbate-dependent monooxygenase, C-terminal domain
MLLDVLLRNKLIFTFLLISFCRLNAQKVTYFDDIQPIIYKNCVTCHRTGQVAPFSLTSFEDVNKRALLISRVTHERYMPPNPSDPTFAKYKNVKILSKEELAMIDDWIAGGKKKGKEKKRVEDTASVTYREPDMVLMLQKPFIIKGNNKEQFRVFVVPTNTKEDLYVEGIDFLPQNKTLAHHCRFMIDTTNKLRADDGIEVGATSEFQKQGVNMSDNFLHGWIPGNTAILYPKGVAKRLPKNADIILNMHYSPSPKEVSENSKILLYLSKTPPKRLVKTFILEENSVVNQPFYIEKDTVIKFYQRSPIIPVDISLISVTPHMHLLGKNFKAYAITPDGDLINLIHIPKWDFNWQMTYQFEKMLRIPKGSVIYSEAEYDNTKENKRNPNQPTKNIEYGWGTKDEMMNLIFQYLEYQKGDEG